MPEVVTLYLVLSPELGDPDQFASSSAARSTLPKPPRLSSAGEQALASLAGARSSGNPGETPRRVASPCANLRPRIAACSQWSRIEALLRNRQFLVAYREARDRWIAGELIPFPMGTYWLRRFAHVPLAA